MRQWVTGSGAGLVEADGVERDVRLGSVGHHRRGVVGVAELDVVVPELHGLGTEGPVERLPLFRRVRQVLPEGSQLGPVLRRRLAGGQAEGLIDREVVHRCVDGGVDVGGVHRAALRTVALQQAVPRTARRTAASFQHRL